MKNKFKGMTCLILLLCNTACMAQLAPSYDQTISDGLTSANKEMQTLFASVDSGVDKSTYPKRADAYNRLIGDLNALEIQVKARPIPSSKITDEVNKLLSSHNISQIANDPNFTDYPSARAIHDASDQIAHMRQADQVAGLRGGEVKAFENAGSTFMIQAITYENFLKRGAK